MTNDISKFDLFKLPVDASKNVLRIMKLGNLFTFSLCSNFTKSLVRSIRLTPEKVSLIIDHNVRIGFNFYRQAPNLLDFYGEPLWWRIPKPLIRLDQPLFLQMNFYREIGEHRWMATQLDLRGWIKHVLYILNVPKLYLVDFITFPRHFDYQSITAAFDGLHKGRFRLDKFPTDASIISDFQPMEFLMLLQNPSCKALFSQNFQSLSLTGEANMEIEELLANNCKFLCLSASEKDVNKFLKNWIKGSNPRLKYVRIFLHSQRVSLPDAILKGTNYKVAPVERMLTFEIEGVYYDETRKVQGGYDIWRKKDGTTATIKFDSSQRSFYMYVWP